jgi:hypothetical protein
MHGVNVIPTYATRLSLSRKKLQLLVITEFNENVDRPLVIIIMGADADFTCTTNACKSR